MSLIRVGDIVIDENIDGNIVIDKIRGNCHQWELGTLTSMRVRDIVIYQSLGHCHLSELGTLSLIRVGDIVIDKSWGHCH